MTHAKQSSSAATRKQAFADHVVEMMSGLGPVEAKRMFGGHGVYLHGLMFAITYDDVLYLKVDEETEPEFLARGLKPFQYQAKNEKVASLRYYQAPPEVYDDPQQMVQWARLGHESALRRQAMRPSKRQQNGQSKAIPQVTQARPERRTASSALAKAGASGKEVADHLALSAMRNLGPKSAEMLAEAGIKTLAQLCKLGAVKAYVRAKAKHPGASLNLLWALEGALTDKDWKVVAETDRASLLMALEDVERHAAG